METSAEQKLRDEIKKIEEEIKELKGELEDMSGPLKLTTTREIRQLEKDKHIKQARLDELAEETGAEPITSKLKGTISFQIFHKNVPEPLSDNTSITLWFNPSLTGVQILSFPPVVTPPFKTSYGDNITTITKISEASGDFDSSSGRITIPVEFRFDHSIDVPLYQEDSNIKFTLTTGTIKTKSGALSGTPLDSSGKMTLVGSSHFEGGYLNKVACNLTIEGIATPSPL